MTRIFLMIFCCWILFIYSCKEEYEGGGNKYVPPPAGYFRNPVFQPVLADPSVIKANDGYFYAYGTQDDWGDGSGNHIVPMLRSKDLVSWTYVGNVFDKTPTWKTQGYIWAPDINYVNNQYYLYYSYSYWNDPNPGIGLAIADKPEGPFTDQGKLIMSQDIGVQNSIDPFYMEESGMKYLFWGSFAGIFGVQLTEDGKNLAGEKFRIAGNWFEGSYIYKKDGYFYYFGSNGNCCEGAETKYKVLIARSSDIKGPYLNKNGEAITQKEGSVFIQGNANGGFAGPGHNAEIITDDAGTDWFIYHAVDKNKPYLPNGATRRPLMLDKITWENGWPTITDNQPGVKDQKKPVFKN